MGVRCDVGHLHRVRLWRFLQDWWGYMSRVVNGDSYQVGSGHLAAIYQATVTLTDAQIKALPTTPITVVSAPGANKVIQPIFANLFAKTTSGAYTNINAAANLTLAMPSLFAMSYIPNDAAMTTIGSHTRLTDILGGANNRRAELMPFFETEAVDSWGPVGTIGASTGGVNEALQVLIDNGGSGALTGGNAANSLTVVVLYSIVDVP